MSVVKSYDLMTPDQQMAYRMGVMAAREAVDDAEILSAWKAVALAAIDKVVKP